MSLDTTDLSPAGSDSVGDTGVIRSRRGGAGAAFRPSRSSAIRGGGGGARGRSSRGGRSSGSRPVRPVGGGGAAGGGDRPPYGYSASPYPSVGGPEPCPHCFCSPCVINNPPTFLVGSCPPDIRNSSKRYPLYRKFWRVLREIGLWRHEPYLVRKATRTSCDDVREIMPTCVTRVSGSYTCTDIHCYTCTYVTERLSCVLFTCTCN